MLELLISKKVLPTFKLKVLNLNLEVLDFIAEVGNLVRERLLFKLLS